MLKHTVRETLDVKLASQHPGRVDTAHRFAPPSACGTPSNCVQFDGKYHLHGNPACVSATADCLIRLRTWLCFHIASVSHPSDACRDARASKLLPISPLFSSSGFGSSLNPFPIPPFSCLHTIPLSACLYRHRISTGLLSTVVLTLAKDNHILSHVSN